MPDPIPWQLLAIITLVGFLCIFSFVWIILYSSTPFYVRYKKNGEIFTNINDPPDPVLCIIWSIFISIVITVILLLIYFCTV